MGSNPAFVYECTDPDQDFDIMKSFSHITGSEAASETSISESPLQKPVLINAGVTIPMDSTFSPIKGCPLQVVVSPILSLAIAAFRKSLYPLFVG